MDISVIIPCYNSNDTIINVCDELIEQLSKREKTYEIILVNDASPVSMDEVLLKLAENKDIKVINFAINKGKHAALMAGFRWSKGEIIICVDDDSQCPVENLWQLIQPLYNGADIAMASYGVKEQSRFKNLGSNINDWMMTTMLGKPKDFKFSNFAAIQRYIITEIIKYENQYTYVNGLLLRTTNNMVNVDMKERARMAGVSGYTFKKSFKLWLDGYTAFSIYPLQIAGKMGVMFALMGFIFMSIIIIKKLINPFMVDGYASIISVIIMLSGVTLMILGILGEYIGRIYMCINRAPQYVIKNTLNIQEGKDGNEKY